MNENVPDTYLRQWRHYSRLTLEEAAYRAGLSHSQLSRIERGQSNYTRSTLEALADAYGCSPSDLIGQDPSNKVPTEGKLDEKHHYLAEWRRHRRLTQADVLEATGLHQGLLSRIENGARRYNQTHLTLLAELYGCQEWELLASPPGASIPAEAVPSSQIRAWRLYRGQTQGWLADQIGMTTASLSRIENGKQPYNQRQLVAIAVSLEVEPAELISAAPGSALSQLLRTWNRIPEESRAKALQVLDVFAD